jgi:hypothetical protein
LQVGLITVDGRAVGFIALEGGTNPQPDTVTQASPMLQNAAFMTNDGFGAPRGHEGGHRTARSQGGTDHYTGRQVEGSASPVGGDRVYGGFADARDRARAELKANPDLNEKWMHIFAGENPDPDASTGLWEETINRMAVRGTTLGKELRTTREGGYYEGWRDEVSPSTRKTLEASRDRALNYSNVSNYATDNSSGGLARRDRESGHFTEKQVLNGEHFFGPDNRIADHQKAYNALVNESEAKAREAGASASTGGGRLTGRIDPRVDPRIPEIVGAAAGHLPEGYKVEMTSGYRGEDVPNHNGRAADFHIVDPQGNVLRNRGEDPGGMYQTLARHAYGEMLARHPDLKGRFAWGGAFGTELGGGGERDLMHFDINRERGRYEEHQLRNMGPVPGVKYGPQPKQAASADKPFDPETQAP